MKRFGVAALALSLLGACARKGGASPQDVFDRAQAAGESKDWRTLFSLLDPDKQDGILFRTMLIAGHSVGTDRQAQHEWEALIERHAVRIDQNQPIKLTGVKEEDEKTVGAIFKGVKDKPALFSDLATIVDRHEMDEHVRGMMSLHGKTLRDVRIQGDTATGVVSKKDGSGSAAEFVKRRGRWYLGKFIGG